jgi:Tol biopolymer transport system component
MEARNGREPHVRRTINRLALEPGMQASPISPDSILAQLGKILGSGLFKNAARSRALLKFVVERAVNNQADHLKEYTLGAEALGRGDAFDPRTDPIVRAEASRLRSRLERYYAAEGRADPVVIVVPKGSYVPQFLNRSIEAEGVTASGADPAPTHARRFNRLAAGALAVACAGGIGIWVSQRFARPRESSLIQFDVELKTRGAIGSEVGTDVILSPDGTRLVYVSLGLDGVTHLNTRRLDQSQTTELPGTEGARGPFLSPDGGWVGFEASGKLKKTPVEGGSPVVLCDSTNLVGASWGEDGNIIAALGGNALARIPASGGPPAVILNLAGESAMPAWPQVLPGTKLILFTAIGFPGPNHGSIEALSLATGKRSVLVRGGTYGRYLSNGYLTYVNQGTLFAVPFDLDRMAARNTATPVLDGVSYSFTFGFAQVDFSRTGTLVYRKNNGGQLIAEWIDSAGKAEPFFTKPGRYVWPRLSPDGNRLGLSVVEGGTRGVWIYEGQPDRITKLTSAEEGYLQIWSPDGRYLVLGGTRGLTWRRPDGTGKAEPLIVSGNTQAPCSFSPDGKRLAYHELNSSTGFDLWTVPIRVTGSGPAAGTPELFLGTPAYETYPTFSPDGRWMAYGSNESGNWEVYVRAFPDNGSKAQVSASGGRIPRWSPNGRELFYRTDDQRIMAATYTTKGRSFAVHSRRQWSPVRLADTGVLSNFDLSPDGLRILALMPAVRPEDQQTENHVTIMLNFSDEVRRRVAHHAER